MSAIQLRLIFTSTETTYDKYVEVILALALLLYSCRVSPPLPRDMIVFAPSNPSSLGHTHTRSFLATIHTNKLPNRTFSSYPP